MRRRSIFIIPILIFAVLVFTGFMFIPSPGEQTKTISGFSTGEELAKIFCSSCHLFPDPSLLDKTTWKERVLPNMGWRLGIRKASDDPYKDMEEKERQLIKAENIYPDKPLLPVADWQKIVGYYLQKAPGKPLPQKTPPAFDNELKGFHAEGIFFTKQQVPQVSLLKFDTTTQLLYIGDAQNELCAMRVPRVMAFWKLESAPVDIDLHTPGSPRILCIGSIKPTEKKNGSFYALDSTNASTGQMKRFSNLARPVAVEETDLNDDGKNDLIICQFGNYTGKLSWFDEGDPQKEHILKWQPGARRVEVKDFNADGKPDILVLMSQAREELVLLINKGKGEFSEKKIYQFPPVYGVSYFELADFNRDGHPDILLTNGDNWDLSPIKKNYHGIRILMNDGKNNFKISRFFPFYGVSKAIARDFDGDGDLDIAAIAFYDDPAQPAHSFLYLKNNGQLLFSSASLPVAQNGKWITMEAGDLDHDGDEDIVLGSFVYSMGELGKLVTKGVESFPQAIILWNDKK